MVRDTESPFETASRQMNYCLVLETSLAGDSRLLRQVATLISAGFNLTVIEFGKSIGFQPDNFRLVSVENTRPTGISSASLGDMDFDQREEIRN